MAIRWLRGQDCQHSLRQRPAPWDDLRCQWRTGLVAKVVSGWEGDTALDGRVLAIQCRERVQELGLAELAGRLRVGWNRRLRSTAGRAWLNEGWIELNPRLLEHGRDEVRLTLLHELAHLVAHERHGRGIAPHGAEWQQACAELGIPGAPVTHRLDLPRHRQRKRFLYQCPACGLEMKRVRRMKRQAACLACCRKHADGKFDRRFLMTVRSL